MAESIQIIGIDPGLVDTGIVALNFNWPGTAKLTIDYMVVTHATAPAIKAAVAEVASRTSQHPKKIFCEKYRPRSVLNTDARMMKLQHDLKAEMPNIVLLNNTGIKTVVKPAVLTALELNKFSISTHHDDLRSAARIAVLGMLKDAELNALLYEVIRDYIEQTPWTVFKN